MIIDWEQAHAGNPVVDVSYASHYLVILAALSGEDPRAPKGSIRLFDTDIAQASCRKRRKLGLHFVPEERLGRGAVPCLSLADNTLLTRTEAVKSYAFGASVKARR